MSEPLEPTDEQIEALCAVQDPLPLGMETERARAAWAYVRDQVLEMAAKEFDLCPSDEAWWFCQELREMKGKPR